MGARTVLELATRGGAELLGRTDIGLLEPGRYADFVAISLDRLDYAWIYRLGGSYGLPLRSLNPWKGHFWSRPGSAGGSGPARRPGSRGQAPQAVPARTSLDVPALVERHNRLAAGLLDG